MVFKFSIFVKLDKSLFVLIFLSYLVGVLDSLIVANRGFIQLQQIKNVCIWNCNGFNLSAGLL